ncbi:MAG: protease modulator HflC [Gammaproteobacteria bacterium]
MGSGTGRFVIILLTAVVILVWMSVFMVDERELAVKFRFGEIVKSDYEPGLHFKLPIVNNVRKFDSRILTRNNPTEEFLTNEKKNLIVDFFIKWRIEDVAQYYRATGGDEMIASDRLLEIIKDGIRNEFARRTVQEVVSAERSEIMDSMLERGGDMAQSLGIQVVDVRVKRLDLPEEVSESVFNRMREERRRVAAQLRAEGEEAAARIRADADRQRTVILAEAYRDAEIMRGEGDAASADIYAQAYERNPGFYAFYRSMEAYDNSLGTADDVLVLDPDGEFFRFLSDKAGE